MNWIDIAIIVAYLAGTTLFECSFFFRRGNGGDVAKSFMTGGGALPMGLVRNVLTEPFVPFRGAELKAVRAALAKFRKMGMFMMNPGGKGANGTLAPKDIVPFRRELAGQ